jgi:hypothetical protein
MLIPPFLNFCYSISNFKYPASKRSDCAFFLDASDISGSGVPLALLNPIGLSLSINSSNYLYSPVLAISDTFGKGVPLNALATLSGFVFSFDTFILLMH